MLVLVIKLFVIDDHFLIIEGLYSSFDLASDDFKVVGGSLTINEALQTISTELVNIILLDLFIQQSDPKINLLQVQNAFPAIPIVILSHECCINWQVEMFRYGVKAYISKSEDLSVMRQKLLQVFAGEVIIPDEVAKILFVSKDNKHLSGYFEDVKEIITDLSKGMTVKEIAAKMNQSESAIEKKLQAIRKSYNARTNTELVYKSLIRVIHS